MDADALALARAVLRTAEAKAGVTETAAPIGVDQPDQPRPLATLLPQGRLPRGALTSIRESNTLLLALLATDHRAGGGGTAIVGAPELGMLAAAQAGLELERLVLIPTPTPRPPRFWPRWSTGSTRSCSDPPPAWPRPTGAASSPAPVNATSPSSTHTAPRTRS